MYANFTADDMITLPISEIKNLKENAVPSIFKLKPKSKRRHRKAPAKRNVIEKTSESEILPDSSCDDNDWGQDEIEIENYNLSPVSTSCLNCVSLSDELSRVRVVFH